MLELDLLGGDPEADGHPALDPDRHVAQPDRPVAGVHERLGHDPDRVGEVDDPGVGRAAPADVLGQVQDDGDRPQCLGEAARSGRLLADAAEPMGQGLVDEADRLAADPELDEHERGPVDRGVAVGGRRQPARPADAPADPSGEPGDDLQSLCVDVVEDQLVDRQPVHPVRHALDELGRVGAASADDGDLQAHRPSRCHGA